MPDQMSVTFQEAAAPAPRCPECGGKQLLNHPAGLLVFAHDTMGGCILQDREDSRAVADKDRGAGFERPATDTERTLLAAAGYALPADGVTVVGWLSPGLRRRTWPAATTTTTTAQPDDGAGAA